MNDATRILAEFKEQLDKHFGLKPANPVAPEHRPSEETAAKFARLMKEDDKERSLEERIARIEKALGLNG